MIDFAAQHWGDYHCGPHLVTWHKFSVLITHKLGHCRLVFMNNRTVKYMLLCDDLICFLGQAVLSRLHRLKDNWMSLRARCMFLLGVFLPRVVIHRLASITTIVYTTVLVYTASLRQGHPLGNDHLHVDDLC